MNYKIKDKSVEFLINGKDKSSGMTLILLILVDTILTLVILFAGMNFFADKGKSGLILFAVVMIVFSLALFYFTFLMARRGMFAPYQVQITPETIKVVLRKTDNVVFEEKFDMNKLYVADARIQIGYVSKKLKALCYGSPEQLFVEDVVPSPTLVLLCTGNAQAITDLENQIQNTLNNS